MLAGDHTIPQLKIKNYCREWGGYGPLVAFLYYLSVIYYADRRVRLHVCGVYYADPSMRTH